MQIDGITYQRSAIGLNHSTSGIRGQLRTVNMTKKSISALVREKSVNLIHAHSPCLNGLAALRHGIPLIYEMRSSWEDAAVSTGATKEGSLRYRLSKALETYVVRRADAVVVICDGLKRELLERGVAEDKITVVPNALPPEMFDLPDPASVAEVRERYGLGGARIIGFFGSFFEWEGVDELVKTLPLIVKVVPDAHLLLAGGGRQDDTLRRLVIELDLESQVTFVGRVTHSDVKALYGAVDVMAFPRVSHRLTDMVTPIKPLEAMAQGAVVVASDVGGHKELIRDTDTGILYPAGDREALASTIVKILRSPDVFGEMRERAREYVEMERQWSVVANRYLPVYEALG